MALRAARLQDTSRTALRIFPAAKRSVLRPSSCTTAGGLPTLRIAATAGGLRMIFVPPHPKIFPLVRERNF